MEGSRTRTELLAAGRAALSRGAWDAARECFTRVLAGTPVGEQPAGERAAEAWEGLSWSAWWTEDVPGCLEARERAYRGYRRAGDRYGAARMALWLGDDQIEFYGAAAVADGWFQRAARLLAGLAPSPEHGWLAAFQAHAALERYDTAEATRLAGQARELGHAAGAVDLEMFGLATEGTALVARGAVTRGLQCLDEATTAALAGEYENLAPAAWTCCRLLSACELVGDYDRGGQWCRKVAEFSARMGTRFVTGVCRAHLAAILTWHGRWEEAEQELLGAWETLAANRPVWLPEALVRLGELRRRQGRLDEAEQLFRRAPEHPLGQLGRAAVELDRAAPGAARELLARQLRRVPEHSPTGRAGVLELLVRAELAAGDLAAAESHLPEWERAAAAVGSPPIQAALRYGEGLLAAAAGHRERAVERLEDAADLYARAEAPFELARTRLELSRALLAAGQAGAGRREADAAQQGLRRLGAPVPAVASALATTDAAGGAGAGGGGAGQELLTARQRQVLRLVAEGLTNREIAVRLTLSEHTVHRHVANIFHRLGCSTRATAVAYSSRLGLL